MGSKANDLRYIKCYFQSSQSIMNFCSLCPFFQTKILHFYHVLKSRHYFRWVFVPKSIVWNYSKSYVHHEWRPNDDLAL